MFVSKNAILLKYDYITDFKPRSKVVLEELLADKIIPQSTTVVEQKKNKETILQD